LCWREAWANRSNFSALRGVIMARGGSGFSGQEESGWVLRGSLVAAAAGGLGGSLHGGGAAGGFIDGLTVTGAQEGAYGVLHRAGGLRGFAAGELLELVRGRQVQRHAAITQIPAYTLQKHIFFLFRRIQMNCHQKHAT